MIQRDQELLMYLAEYRILTSRQLAALVDRNRRSVARRLREFSARRWVRQHSLRGHARTGRPEHVFSLTSEGWAALRPGIADDRPSATDLAFPQSQIRHQVMVNTFRLHLVEMERAMAELTCRFLSPDSLLAPPGRDGKPFVHDLVCVKGDRRVGLIPDGVLTMEHTQADRALLMFLEADRGTETLATLARKIARYQAYFRSEGYKRYGSHWGFRLNGFRLLLLCETERSLERLCSVVASAPPSDFIWVSSLSDMEVLGPAGPCWVRGGQLDRWRESILGRFMPADCSAGG